jgi:hypothetical protein
MKRYSFRIITAGIKEDILGICNFLNKDAEYYQDLRETVNQYDQKYQVFAAWLLARNIEPNEYIEAIQKYIDSRRITKFSVGAKAVKINDEVFDDAIKLTEYIHAQFPILQAEKQAENTEIEDVPVVANKDNSIKIFEINDANDGRRLVGDDTRWCIGYKGPKNMWQSYRDSHDASFFVVFDNNPPTENQRKVALDFASGGYGGDTVLLTDIPNMTGHQLSNGWDWDKYSEYLTGKGINLQATRQNPETGQEELILKNKPKTTEERLQNGTFNYIAALGVEDILLWQSGKSKVNGEDRDIERIDKNSLDIIEEISSRSGIAYIVNNPDAKFYTSRWMGLGKRVKDEVLEYLSRSVGGEDLLMKYVNTGMKLEDQQYHFFKQNKNLLTTYLRSQIIAVSVLSYNEFTDLISLNRKDLFKQYIEKRGNLPSTLKYILENHPDYLRLYIETLADSGELYAADDKYFIELDDRDLLIKYLSNVKNTNSGEMQRFIAEDPELFLIYSRNKLTNTDLSDGSSTLGFPIRVMRNAILESGDKSLIKEVALKTGFDYNDFEKAKELGVLEEVKYSILCPKPSNYIAKYYNSDDPFDVSLIAQVKDVNVLQDFSVDHSEFSEWDQKDWEENPTINFAFDLNSHAQMIKKEAHYAYQDKPEEMIPHSPNQTLLWAIYNDGKLFKNFEDMEMSDETKEDFRNAIQEFQSAIQDINFWKNFFKNIDHFAGWIGSKLNFNKDDFSNILKFIPQQFLEDTEIKEFLQRKMNTITSKNFIRNIDIEKTPWLFEDYINQFVEGGNNVYSEFRRLLDKDQDFASEFISKILEKKKLSYDEIEYFASLAPQYKFEFLDLYTHYYPEVKEDPNFYYSSVFNYFNTRPKLNDQLHLLRNYPKYFEMKVLEDDNYVNILPEIRAALVQMYPNLAPKILAYEKKAKYGTGYFDEESGEVMQGKRPSVPKLEEELPDPFAPDDKDEEEPVVASADLMVKIAQKLDLKKKYRLADKLTYILRKKI